MIDSSAPLFTASDTGVTAGSSDGLLNEAWYNCFVGDRFSLDRHHSAFVAKVHADIATIYPNTGFLCTLHVEHHADGSQRVRVVQ